jgi:hypothetical protein
LFPLTRERLGHLPREASGSCLRCWQGMHNKPGQAPQCSPVRTDGNIPYRAVALHLFCPASVLRNLALFLHICRRELSHTGRCQGTVSNNHSCSLSKQDHLHDTASRHVTTSPTRPITHHLACVVSGQHGTQQPASQEPITISNRFSALAMHTDDEAVNQSTTGPSAASRS